MTPLHERLSALLTKVVDYQRSLPDGHAVEMEELQQAGGWDADDIAFIQKHEVTYQPHAVSE